jgi:hypothetical protein
MVPSFNPILEKVLEYIALEHKNAPAAGEQQERQI